MPTHLENIRWLRREDLADIGISYDDSRHGYLAWRTYTPHSGGDWPRLTLCVHLRNARTLAIRSVHKESDNVHWDDWLGIPTSLLCDVAEMICDAVEMIDEAKTALANPTDKEKT